MKGGEESSRNNGDKIEVVTISDSEVMTSPDVSTSKKKSQLPTDTAVKSPSSPEQDEKEQQNDDSNNNNNNSQSTSQQKKNIPPAEWPKRDIKEPHDNDVLYGRGGGTNHHKGNKRYRKMVEDRKVDYVNSKRLDKPLVALEIIRNWRAQDPPGRFLKLDEKTGLWHDVGDKKAREKTSQALREKAPLLRKQQEEEKQKDLGDVIDVMDRRNAGGMQEGGTVIKNTRFNVPEGGGLKKKKPAIVRRDHSLGRDYLGENEAVSLDGFSWRTPVDEIFGQKPSARGGLNPQPRTDPGWGAGSFASTKVAPNSPSSSMPPPPGAPPYRNSSSHDSAKYPTPPGVVQREHSLKNNPLCEASVSQPAPNPFAREERSASAGGLDSAWTTPGASNRGSPPGPSSPSSSSSSAAAAGPSSSSPFGFSPAPSSSSKAAPRFLSTGGNSAFSRTPSGGIPPPPPAPPTPPSLSRKSEPYVKKKPGPGYSAMPEPTPRTWSNASDDYRKVANIIGDSDPYSMGRSWSDHSERSAGGGGGEVADDSATPYSGERGSYSSSGDDSARPHRLDSHGHPSFGPSRPQSDSSQHEYAYGPYGGAGGERGPRSSSGNEYDRRGGPSRPYPPSSSPSSGAPPPSGIPRPNVPKPDLRRKLSGGGMTATDAAAAAVRERTRNLARPQPVKRVTSHQNETDETKPRDHKRCIVTRSALNRDHSLAHHTLQGSDLSQSLAPTVFDDKAEMETLESSMNNSTLSPQRPVVPNSNCRKPSLISSDKRMTTSDAVTLAFAEEIKDGEKMVDGSAETNGGSSAVPKPSMLSSEQRLRTEDVNNLLESLEGKKEASSALQKDETGKGGENLKPLPSDSKPPSLSSSGRLSTMDAINSMALDDFQGDSAVLDSVTTDWLKDIEPADMS